jgi:uncharacterized protein (TIGR02284 family)
MVRAQMIERLNGLIQLDVDAAEAYGQAIKHVKYDDIHKKFVEFQGDHANHVRNLTEMVQQLGGQPVKATPDFKGYLIEGFTALRSITGTKGALEAMKSNEILTNRRYEEVAALDLPPEVMKLVKSHLTHEQLHLQYIEEILTIPRREL